LYESLYLADKIREQLKLKGLSAKNMLTELKFGSNTMSHLNQGFAISHDRLAKIADYLDCSVDYLLGRTDNPEINK